MSTFEQKRRLALIQAKRWYNLIPHPVQLDLMDAVHNGVRFPVVPAGRRSGKTERLKRFVAREAMRDPGMYFLAAPTHDQARKIFWDDMKRFTISALHPRRPSESRMEIYLPNQGTITVLGLDKPERFEGVAWRGGGIDEIANVKEKAWAENILPALNTVNPEDPDYRAWCWLIGVPEGLNHYYDMAEYAETSGDPQWKVFHWKSAEILPPDIIDAARRVLSIKQFRQEFEGSFETASGRIYEDYGTPNTCKKKIKKHEQLIWCHDQNFTPMSSAVAVERGNNIYFLDEIILESAVARQSAEEFVDKFQNHENKHVLIYGDPAGRAGEKHGHKSDYLAIEEVLRKNGWSYTRKVKNKAPAIRDRQNAVRAKICNAFGDRFLFVNPSKAKYTHKGLATCQLKEGSTFQEEQTKYQHVTTALGYYIESKWPVNRFGATNTELINVLGG